MCDSLGGCEGGESDRDKRNDGVVGIFCGGFILGDERWGIEGEQAMVGKRDKVFWFLWVGVGGKKKKLLICYDS